MFVEDDTVTFCMSDECTREAMRDSTHEFDAVVASCRLVELVLGFGFQS